MRVVAAGGPAGRALAASGADVRMLDVDPAGAEPPVEGSADVLVWDGGAAFAAGAAPGALDGAWLAVRAVATAVFIPEGRGGKVVLVAPPPGDEHAEAARAGLENLARTLSIEWARFGVRTAAILPGPRSRPEDIGTLAAYLASRAGDYFSGTALRLS